MNTKTIRIMLDEYQRVKDFINLTREENNEVTVRSGKYVVDGKSILGVFSLDLTQPLVVECYSDNLIESLRKYEVY